jgi:MFS family permease
LFTTIGALVASRQPKNTIGWIFCAMGLFSTSSVASGQYAIYAVVSSPGSLPWGGTAAWLEAFLGGPIIIALFALLLLLFPDGRTPSHRWRAALWLDLIVAVLLFVGSFKPGPMETSSLDVANPLGIEEIGALLNALLFVGVYLALALTVLGVVSLMVRMRRSRAEERQQIKWFAFAGAIMCAVLATGPLLWSLSRSSPGVTLIWPLLFISAVSTIPVATGIAILKYRLYDIDVLINRTLVYGALTATLALVYFGGIATTEAIFRALTGQKQQPQLAIVVSTLVISALFNPLRRRIQSFIDRRFYRSKYDTRKTLEAFSAKLRDETDLDALSDDLVGVVRVTMQPAHVSLWLHPDSALTDKKKRAAIRESGREEE